MSVLIKDMKKPTCCYEVINGEIEYCPFVDDDSNCVLLLKNGIRDESWEDQYSKCPMNEAPEYDAISRQAALNSPVAMVSDGLDWIPAYHIKGLPPAQPEQRWIPFVLRPATDEEKEENPDLDYFLEGKIPEDGQKILITVRLPGHEEVQADEFYSDADGSYLDGQYEIGTEAVAWMPMPTAYKEEKE